MENKKKISKKENIFYDPSLKKRHAKAKIFKYFTIVSLTFSLIFLTIFLSDMVIKGSTAVQQTYVQVEVSYNEKSAKSYRKAVERKYLNIVSRAALREIPMQIQNNPDLMNTTKLIWMLADDQVDMYMKDYYYKIKSKDLKTIEELVRNDRLEKRFNDIFFTQGDSKTPEYSGILSAMIGTVMTLFVAMIVAFPVGVATAVYLEEFSTQNK